MARKLRCPDKRAPLADRRLETGDQDVQDVQKRTPTEGHLHDSVAREFKVSAQEDTLG